MGNRVLLVRAEMGVGVQGSSNNKGMLWVLVDIMDPEGKYLGCQGIQSITLIIRVRAGWLGIQEVRSVCLDNQQMREQMLDLHQDLGLEYNLNLQRQQLDQGDLCLLVLIQELAKVLQC